jgi:hypothetical protein
MCVYVCVNTRYHLIYEYMNTYIYFYIHICIYSGQWRSLKKCEDFIRTIGKGLFVIEETRKNRNVRIHECVCTINACILCVFRYVCICIYMCFCIFLNVFIKLFIRHIHIFIYRHVFWKTYVYRF